MPAYYLDTSALVKRYAAEVGSTWVVRLVDPPTGHDLYTVRLTGVGVVDALVRKVRTGQVAIPDAQRAMGDFTLDWRYQFIIIEADGTVVDQAMHLAEVHGLRGSDAVHLAAALELHLRRQALGLPSLTFVSADTGQMQVVTAEGLRTDDPNTHP